MVSVGGVSAMVSRSASGSRLIAAKVSARSLNSCPWTSATGATSAAAAASAGTRLRSSLRGLDRLRMTGSSRAKKGLSAPIVVLMSSPRPANASPNPSRAWRAATRVRGENIDSTSSSSGDSELALRRGTVSPAWNVLLAPAGDHLDVLEPERGAGPHAEARVDRQRLDLLVELEVQQRRSSAPCRSPCAARSWMPSTTPTRKPPARTSLPLTSLAALGTSALQLVGGHERQPLVRVVGDEDRDDRDEHGRGADQDRAGNELWAALPHGPSR